jgi:hypothetical protein
MANDAIVPIINPAATAETGLGRGFSDVSRRAKT